MLKENDLSLFVGVLLLNSEHSQDKVVLCDDIMCVYLVPTTQLVNHRPEHRVFLVLVMLYLFVWIHLFLDLLFHLQYRVFVFDCLLLKGMEVGDLLLDTLDDVA